MGVVKLFETPRHAVSSEDEDIVAGVGDVLGRGFSAQVSALRLDDEIALAGEDDLKQLAAQYSLPLMAFRMRKDVLDADLNRVVRQI